MTWPVPVPGLVIRYSYLWAKEAELGLEEGIKDRPCAIVLAVRRGGSEMIVRVLPVTHSAPADPLDGLEIPLATKRRLGLDDAPSWVALTEANDFVWPGPDLRPVKSGDPASLAYGMLPPGFMRVLAERLARRWRELRSEAVRRTQ